MRSLSTQLEPPTVFDDLDAALGHSVDNFKFPGHIFCTDLVNVMRQGFVVDFRSWDSRLRPNASYIPVDNTFQLQELDIHVDFRVPGAGGITYTSILTNLAPSVPKLRLVGPMPRYIEAATLSFPNSMHLAVMRLPNGHRNVSRIFQKWTFDSVTHLYVSSYMRDETVEAFWSIPRPNIMFLHLDQSPVLMVARTISNATPNLEVLEFVHTITWGDI